ncbi:hypothetical protein [Halorhodospira halophila]|uniref:Guanylate cyclase domain-containing protein n=1 Tax=Halorhodospira halophila (strain DSM 244 / SL1) TaxID=349124 RepID=A1WW63_HALHL|nr:hypothetical protein [Halorhodospira halophila]ABM61925.1 conserved hypothetical protein [Halorhodospira halophila SL1]
MNYEDRVVCFLDILGFRGHVAGTIDPDGTEEKDRTDHLIAAFEGIRDILDIDRQQDREGEEVTQFSDSVVISFRATEESGVFYALLNIMWVQVNLVLRGILCRGAVAQGKLIHTPKVLFGPGMVDAYVLESKAALYPRVILDESIINLGARAHARHHLPEHEVQSIMSLLEKDSDGMYYINYVTGAQSELDDPELDYPKYLYCLQQIVESGLAVRDPSVAVKYRWLREKLQPHIESIKTGVAENRPEGDELRDAYESIPDL